MAATSNILLSIICMFTFSFNLKILINLLVIFLKPDSFQSSNGYGNISIWTINRAISVDMFTMGGRPRSGFVIVSQGDTGCD